MRATMWMLILVLAAAGCSSQRPDPLEKVNRQVFGLNEFVDRAVLKDVAMAYEKNIPVRLRQRVDNFFNNLAYGNVILNDHLQGQFAKGWRNTGRMALNSTLGLGGLFDVASRHGLYRERNDFGITLGKWGAGSGPYLVLPLLGPSSARDVPAIVVSRVTNPMFWLNPPLEVSLPLDVLSVVDQRAQLQPQIELRDRAALDKYTFTRDVYLRHRAAQIGETLPEQDIYETGEEEEEPVPDAPGAVDYMR